MGRVAGAETAAQKVATMTEVGYGILGLIGALAGVLAGLSSGLVGIAIIWMSKRPGTSP